MRESPPVTGVGEALGVEDEDTEGVVVVDIVDKSLIVFGGRRLGALVRFFSRAKSLPENTDADVKCAAH